MHPIPYNSHLFREVSNLIPNTEVIYLDKLGLNEYYNPYFEKKYKNDYDLLKGHNSIFLKNINEKSNITGFFSRINPGVIKFFIKNKKTSHVLINGYQTFSSWLILICSIIFNKKIIFRGESIKTKRSIISKIIIKFFFRNISFFLYSCSGNYSFYKSFNISDSKLIYGPCSVDYDFFLSQKKKINSNNIMNFRNKISFKKNYKTIIFVSKFIERKNPLELLKSIIPLKDKVQIVFVGDGPMKKSIKEYANKHSINIILTGFLNQSELSLPYLISDLYVNTSLYDASPKTLNEALCYNLPIVSSNQVGQATDIIEYGINGYIYEVRNIKDLTEKIELALKLKKNNIVDTNNQKIKLTSSIVFGKNLYNSLNED